MKRIVFSIALLSVLFLSCSLSQFGWKEEGDGKKRSERKTAYVEDFDPLTLNDDDLTVTPPDKMIEKEPIVVPEAVMEMTESEEVTNEVARGFRVQVLLTGSEAQANEATKKARMRFQENVYRIFEIPYWKIRVGDCMTKKEAELLKEVAVKNGYTDSWIVPSEVIRVK